MNDHIDPSRFDRVDNLTVDHILKQVCEMFGEFDPNVVIEGVYFGERRYPHTIYPSQNNRFVVGICIPRHQADEPLAILCNLSHELVHCLSPNGFPPQATVLEEGLAEHAKVYLGRKHYQRFYPDYDFRELLGERYRHAFDKIEELVDFESLAGMRHGIRTVRSVTGRPFSQITEDDLAKQFVNTPRVLLKELSARFHV